MVLVKRGEGVNGVCKKRVLVVLVKRRDQVSGVSKKRRGA